MEKKLIFIQLNEINFDLVEKYIAGSKKDKFPNLFYIKKNFKNFLTYSENQYEKLEPWIQWPSVYLGKEYVDHKIFRLGDIVNHPEQKQIFEIIEEKGFTVGAISPMNAENRLKKQVYFIPDPWTNTNSDKSSFSKRLSLMLKQTVNDNASNRLSFKSILTILEIIFRTFHFKKTLFLLKMIFSAFIKSWKKSLVLDYMIHLIHLKLLKEKNPNFSTIFFNSGAHIQHHYFYNTKFLSNLPKNPEWYINSSFDPIEDMLEVYDQIIGDYLNLNKEKNLLISTGLQQVPFKKIQFYYRLKNHLLFMKSIGIKCSNILPRMTRDFEIIFDNNNNLIKAQKILKNIKLNRDNLNIFNEIEVRNKSLFVTLTYPNEIKKNDYVIVNDDLKLNFFNEVVFVAIKNGMHDTGGYVFSTPHTDLEIPKEKVHVSKIHNIILNYFKI